MYYRLPFDLKGTQVNHQLFDRNIGTYQDQGK